MMAKKILFILMIAALITVPIAGSLLLQSSESVLPEETSAANSKTIDMVIIMGDSISMGSGATSRSNTYAGIIVDKIKQNNNKKVDYIMVANAGTETDALLPQAKKVVEKLSKPVQGHTVVVLTSGSNDLKKYGSSGTLPKAVDNIQAMVDYYKSKKVYFKGGVTIYLATVYDPSDGTGDFSNCKYLLNGEKADPQILVQWKNRYQALAEKNNQILTTVDVHGKFLGHGYFYNNPKKNNYYDKNDPSYWFADCVHPNNRGHLELGQAFYHQIKTIFE